MTTQLLARKSFTIQPVTYPLTAEEISERAAEYMVLTVSGVDDKAGLETVHKARMKFKNARLEIEKRRKELKAESLEYGRHVDAAAKELTALIAPVESHLEHEEGIVERERARIAREKEEQRQQIIRERLQLLRDLEAMVPVEEVAALSASEFSVLLGAKTAEKKQRDEMLAAQEAERNRVAEQQRIEAARLAKEKVAIDRVRQEQAAEQAKIDAESKRIADAKAEAERLAELEKARAEAVEVERQRQARLEEERQKAAVLRKQQEEAEAKARAEAEAAEQKRLESLRPDHNKLDAIADAVLAIEIPAVSAAAETTAQAIRELLEDTAIKIRDAANSLVTKKGRK